MRTPLLYLKMYVRVAWHEWQQAYYNQYNMFFLFFPFIGNRIILIMSQQQ